MQREEIYLVADQHLVRSTDAEISAAEAELGAGFPSGFRSWMTSLGAGVLSDLVRIYPLPRLVELVGETRARWREYYFWDEGHDVLPRDRALESILVADTLNGDEVIFHPSDPGVLYLLPRNDEQIYRVGQTFDEALDWLCTSGVVAEPVSLQYFEPFTRYRRVDLASAEDVATSDLADGLVALGLHDHLWIDEDEGCVMLYLRAIQGWVACFVFPDMSAVASVTYAVEDTNATVAALAAALGRWGFRVNRGPYDWGGFEPATPEGV